MEFDFFWEKGEGRREKGEGRREKGEGWLRFCSGQVEKGEFEKNTS
ncbi:hypothetical protein SAMN06298216_3157 [Spirosomataceae bacterium TFI 002]|nr:hypothetical protein SAMN06298216_3157 [Spirosomataceae bacterium TFI 002]